MSTKTTKNVGSYWQGQTDAKLEAMATALNEVKLTLAKVDEKLDSLSMWRAKVAGISAFVAGVIALLVKFVS